MARSNFIVRGGADFSGIKKELVKTQSQLQSFQTKVSGIMKSIGITLSALAVGKFIKDSTAMAMGVESAMDNISRNMGSAAKAFQSWVNTQSKALGMAKADAYTYGSTFSNLLSSFTSGAEDTAQKTQELMKAAAIIASKTGRSYEDTAERIRSGLLGSTEAIEDLGVYTQVSMLESTEAFKKFAGNKSWNQLTYQTQQQIRLAAILEQTYKRYGDTLADTTQTRQAQFLASLKNIQLTLGQAFLPIYNAVLPALTAMADAINRVVSIFAQFTQALFGNAATSQVKATQQQAAAMTDLGDATEEAGKQAKGALMGFDEINQLADSAEGAAGTASTAAATTTPTAIMGATGTEEPSKMQELAEKFKAAFEPAAAAFERLKSAAEPVITNIGQGLRWFYDNVLVPFGSWVISDAVPAWLNMVAAQISLLNPVIEAFKPIAQWLWTNLLLPIANWTGDAFITWWQLLTEAFKALGDWMSQNKDMVTAGLAGILAGILAYKAITGIPAAITAVKGALSGLSVLFGALTSPISLIVLAIAALTAGFVYFYTTNEKFRGVVDGVLNAIRDAAVFLWQNVMVPLGQFLSTVFVAAWNAVTVVAQWLWQNILVPLGNFLLWLWNSVFVPIGAILLDVLGVAFQTVSDIAMSFWQNVLVPLGSALSEMFQPTVEAVSTVLLFLWNNVLVPLGSFLIGVFKGILETVINVFTFLWKNVLKPIAEYVGGVFADVFDTVFRFIGDIVEGLKEIFIGLMNFITGVFTGNWEKAWEGVREIFKGIFDSLWGIVKFPLNLIIDGINAVIGALNSISITVPDWVPVLGGKSFGISIPKIPKLAEGGIITSPTIAMIGERGSEAVVPLENTGFVDAIASAVGSAVLAAMQAVSQSTSTGDKEIVINVDGVRLARILVPSLNSEAQRIGFRPILQTGGSGL